MAKRFALVALREDIRDHFGVSGGGGRVPPRYNIGQDEPILVVVIPPGQTQRRLLPVRWGLIPSNAANETEGTGRTALPLQRVRRRPALAELLTRQRCLVPANGFYLWRRDRGRIQPFHVRRGDGDLFGLAAVWDAWRPPAGPPVHSCALLLGPANPLLADFGAGTPIVVPSAGYAAWLDPVRDDTADLPPWDDSDFTVYPVSPSVNRTGRDTPRCVARLP